MRLPLTWITIGILVAALLRLHGLADQGFFMFDEARFVLEARELGAQISWAIDSEKNMGAGGVIAPFEHRDFAEGTARPLHVVVMTLLRAQVPSMLLFQALCGILLVPAIAALAGTLSQQPSPSASGPTGGPAITRTRNAGPGYAAILAAVSPALVFWSRTLLAEIDAILPFVLFLVALLGPRGTRRELAAGLLAGLALTVQSRMALILPVTLLFDLVLHRSWSRLYRIGVGMLVPVLLLQSGSVFLKFAFSQAGQPDRVETYFDQLVNRAGIDGGGFALNRPFFALRYLALVEGPAWTALALMTTVLLLRRRGPAAAGPLLVAGTFLWVVVLATTYDQHRFSGERYGRMLAPAVPLGTALVGHLVGRLRERSLALALIVFVAVLATRPVSLVPLYNMHSDQAAVLEEAAAKTGTATVWSEEPLHVAVHLGPDSFPARFVPRSDTLTVVIMDDPYARNFGFWRFLPDTPAFVLLRQGHVASPLVRLENANHRDDFELSENAQQPAAVYLLGPDSTVVP